MIKKLQAGDSTIPASGWNEMRAFINNYSAPQDTFKNAPRNPFLISVKNVTGAALDPLSIVAIKTPTYSTRTGATFANKGVEYGVEFNAETPTGADDNIAVLQGGVQNNCIGRAIADGLTPCFINKAENKNYQYAKPVASHSDYLEGTDDVTNIRILWIASGTGKKEAIISIDASGEPEQEYFTINYGNDGTGTAANDPTVYVAGSLHYIYYNTQYKQWLPLSGNEGTPGGVSARPAGSKLVVCQVDAPHSAKEFQVPYFTPESNIGVPPKISTYNHGYAGDRCGVLLGEHEFSNSSFDYQITGIDGSAGTVTSGTGLTFIYNPVFFECVEVSGTTGGGNIPYADVFGESWAVDVPTSGISTMNYPDIYPNDSVLAMVDFENQRCWAIDYATDYPAGTLMPLYYAPGRGWDVVTTPQGLLDLGFTLYQKVKTDAIT